MVAFRRTAAGEYLAEVIGTFVLICFGDSAASLGARCPAT
jgi:glycerol uptake facilitator-like aquaporin